MTEAAMRALQAALAAEHAAVYGYGVAGAMLSGADRTAALHDWRIHQDARDTLQVMIAKLGAVPVAANAAYELPFPVHDPRSARRLAAALEEGVTQAYLGLVAVTDPTLRTFGALAMQPPANRAAAWRGSTVAFPGMPSAAIPKTLPGYSAPRGSASTRAMADAAASTSSAIEIRSAQDHQNHQRPSLPQPTYTLSSSALAAGFTT